MSKGIIFNIQKFSIHDGPGIRTTIFFKGCPLKCAWCSGGGGGGGKVQILYDKNKCRHCLTCINTCKQHAISLVDNQIKIDFDKCVGCLQCVSSCFNNALSHEGKYQEIDEIVDICLQDQDFYEESGGGVTISGGEGMAQPKFLKELVTRLKEHNLHVAIETTGYIQSDIFKELAVMFDLLLFDVKHYDTNKHYEGTKVHNELIIDNLKWAIDHGLTVLPRIPVIPGFNDSNNDAKQFSALLHALSTNRCQLLPFHQFGENKYHLLSRPYDYENVPSLHREDLEDYCDTFHQCGIDAFF